MSLGRVACRREIPNDHVPVLGRCENVTRVSRPAKVQMSKRKLEGILEITHSTLVIFLTCPSSHLIGARVSRSHISTEPFARAAAMNLPVGSNFENVAPANREVCTAVGCESVNGSKAWSKRVERVDIETRRTDECLIHCRGKVSDDSCAFFRPSNVISLVQQVPRKTKKAAACLRFKLKLKSQESAFRSHDDFWFYFQAKSAPSLTLNDNCSVQLSVYCLKRTVHLTRETVHWHTLSVL